MLRKFFLIALMLVLFMLPTRLEMHYITSYYILLVVLSIASIVREFLGYNLKENKVKRWRQKRKRGFVVTFIIHTIYFIIHVTSIVLLSQLFVNGITPSMIVQQVEFGTLVFLLVLTSIIAMVGSFAYWNENEKMIR